MCVNRSSGWLEVGEDGQERDAVKVSSPRGCGGSCQAWKIGGETGRKRDPHLLGAPPGASSGPDTAVYYWSGVSASEVGVGKGLPCPPACCLPPPPPACCLHRVREESVQIQHHTAFYRERAQRSPHDCTVAHGASHQIQTMPSHPGDSLVSDTGLCAGSSLYKGHSRRRADPICLLSPASSKSCKTIAKSMGCGSQISCFFALSCHKAHSSS